MERGNSISNFFSDLTEPRESNRRHKLIDMITIALCAVICGADTWEEIEEFGQAKAAWFERFLELLHGIPACDTFARSFASMDPKEFQQAFLGWVEFIQSIARGRIETRRYWTTSDIDWLPEKDNWKNLSTIVMAQRERYQNGETGTEVHSYITSLGSNAKKVAEAVRGHWGIENSLHWVLDIALREDECRIRKDHAPANFATLRHMALNLLRQENSRRRSVKTKRPKAGWDMDYLNKMLRDYVQ
jgi:predicted transposase YbfD/YdcC